jgi:uncharacterized linocin/CFP29 family protein
MMMDLFKQNLAPIPSEAWEEINDRAEKAIKSVISIRKALHVEGPFDVKLTSVPTGRITLFKDQSSKVRAGLYDNVSLLETRVQFELSRWELDNILRGTKDINLDALDQAALDIASFEENALINGHKEAKITGLLQEAKKTVDVKDESSAILQAISEAVIHLERRFAAKPHVLLAGEKLYQALNKIHGAKLLREIVEHMIGGTVVRSERLEGGLLLPLDHDDLELTIGQDYTIGYEYHDQNSVRFFIMNSFALRVLDPELIVRFNF